MKGHCNLHILFLGFNNRTDARVSWFSKQNIFWKKIKKILWFFCVNKYHDMLKFQKLILTYLNFWIQKNAKKKMKFLILFLCKKIRWYFVYNKKLKKLKVSVLFIFFKKIYFGMLNKKIEKMSVVFVFFEKIFLSVKRKLIKNVMMMFCLE